MLLALALVAFLSVVAVFQVVIVSLGEERIGSWLGKGKLFLIIGVAETALIAYPGWHPEIIGTLDLIIGSWFMVTGGLLAVLAITYFQCGSTAIASPNHVSLDALCNPYRPFLNRRRFYL